MVCFNIAAKTQDGNHQKDFFGRTSRLLGEATQYPAKGPGKSPLIILLKVSLLDPARAAKAGYWV